MWVVALAAAAALYWMENDQPALHEMVEPLYYILAIVMVIVTWRWFRVRGRQDRRHSDRRHSDRRGTDEDGATS